MLSDLIDGQLSVYYLVLFLYLYNDYPWASYLHPCTSVTNLVLAELGDLFGWLGNRMFGGM